MTNQLIEIGSKTQLTGNEYLSELLHYQALDTVPTIKNLIDQAIATMTSLADGKLPAALPVMELPESVIEEIQRYVLGKYPTDQEAGNALWLEMTEPLEEIDYLLRHLRDELIGTFSMYGFVSSDFVRDLSAYTQGQPVLELMAGHGYISAGLRALKPEQAIYATDNEDWRNQPDPTKAQPVTEVAHLDALAALEAYGEEVSTVIMSWAPDTTTADLDVLTFIRDNAYRFDFDFIVIGERDGATDSAAFWQTAKLTEVPELNVHHTSFDLIDERVYVVE